MIFAIVSSAAFFVFRTAGAPKGRFLAMLEPLSIDRARSTFGCPFGYFFVFIPQRIKIVTAIAIKTIKTQIPIPAAAFSLI